MTSDLGRDDTDPSRIEALFDLGRWDEAIRLASIRVARNPGDAPSLVLLAHSLLGAGRAKEAVGPARAARAAAPDWDEPCRLESWAIAPSSRKQAEAAARDAVDRNPSRADNWVAAASAALNAGHLESAAEAALRACQLAPDWPEAFNVRGLVALRAGGRQAAEQCFRSGLALDPTNASLLNNLALSMRQQGRLDEAVPLFERAVVQAPGRRSARLNLGETMQRQSLLGGPLGLLVVFLLLALIAGVLRITWLMWVAIGCNLAAGAWVMVRRRSLSEAHRSALRDFEDRKLTPRREKVTRRIGRVLIVVAGLAIVGLVIIGITGAFQHPVKPPPCAHGVTTEYPGGPLLRC